MEEKASEDERPEFKIMGLTEHLGELRSRLIRSFMALLVLFFIAMSYSTPILEFLKRPLRVAMPNQANLLHFTSPLEPFMAQMKVAMLVSFILGCPIWIYQFWKFVEPALYPKEKKYILPFIVSSVLLFFLGVLFCFYIMLPMALEFLLALGAESATPMITIDEYLSMVMVLIFAFGLIFETPLILVLLATLGLIDAEMLAKNRRIIIVIILVVAALLTPPDPISQMAMAIPTYIMFEAAILVIRFIEKRQKQEQQPNKPQEKS